MAGALFQVVRRGEVNVNNSPHLRLRLGAAAFASSSVQNCSEAGIVGVHNPSRSLASTACLACCFCSWRITARRYSLTVPNPSASACFSTNSFMDPGNDMFMVAIVRFLLTPTITCLAKFAKSQHAPLQEMVASSLMFGSQTSH